MKTVKVTVVAALILGAAVSLFAQSGGIVFITSNPLGATIDLDGAELKSKTPLIIRGLGEGEHQFRVVKIGYIDQSIQFDLQRSETKVLHLQLTDTGFKSRFPLESELVIHGEQNRAESNLFHFDQGRYQIVREADVLHIDPIFPHQRLIDALNIAVPIVFAFTGILTAEAIIDPPQSGSLPWTLWAAHGIGAGLLSLDIALYFDRQKFDRSFAYRQQIVTQSEQHAQELFAQAESSLNSGNLEQALISYGEIQDFFPESVQTPFALYRIASIYLLQGKQAMALKTFDRIQGEYPLPELYDRAQKNLADLYLSQGKFEESLSHLDNMVFLDPFFNREEIDLYRCEILEQSVDRDRSEIDRLLEFLHQLVERYPQSDSLSWYQFKLAQYLLESGNPDGAREQLQMIKETPDSRLQERIKTLQSRLGGF